MIYVSGEVNMKPKDDDDQAMGRMTNGFKSTSNNKAKLNGKGAQIISSVNWNLYLQKFENIPREKLLMELGSVLLQAPSEINEEILNKFVDSSSREKFIKTATIQLMSTPEYQLC
jgi:hypothetical protein